MRFKFPAFTFLGGFLFISIFISQCKLDEGLDFRNPNDSISHGIKGNIVFNGAWPSEVSEARLVASSNFPPDPSQPLDSFVFSDPIQLGVQSVDYGLSLDPATYQIVAVIFRERNRPWDISNILAVYAPLSPCTIIPDLNQAVVVESESSIVEGVDIFVDLNKGSLSGGVSFVGEWPAEIGFAGIIALEHPLNFPNLIPCGLAILPLNVESANYKIRVPANTYSLLVVAGESLASITNITDVRIIGTYFAPEDPTRPGVVKVSSNQDTPNVDIVADLSLFSK